MDEMDILPKFMGTSVHDGLASYNQYGNYSGSRFRVLDFLKHYI